VIFQGHTVAETLKTEAEMTGGRRQILVLEDDGGIVPRDGGKRQLPTGLYRP
jgi:hypothetical protein